MCEALDKHRAPEWGLQLFLNAVHLQRERFAVCSSIPSTVASWLVNSDNVTPKRWIRLDKNLPMICRVHEMV